MALSDILNRIASDAGRESKAIVDAANAEAERLVADATEAATGAARRFERDSAREAERDAGTVLAGARLKARDAEVAARGELVARALDELQARIVALPDAQYAAFIARAIVDAAAGDEVVRIAEADSKRLAGLDAAVTAAAGARGRTLDLRFETTPADIAHGVVLLGDRSVNDLSVAGLVEAQREALVMKLAAALFDEGKDGA